MLLHPPPARRRALPRAPLTLVTLSLMLVGCGASVPQHGPVAYSHGSGHILVQLFHGPGFIYPPITLVPAWTLYGDGTLLYQAPAQPPDATNPTGLLAAHLTPSEVDHILDVVVNQDTFFASARPAYGQYNPDIGATFLTVDAAGKHKQVRLGQGPGPSPDSETAHVFAIASFLSEYHPAQTAPYVAPGLALLVYRQAATSAPAGQAVRPWPYAAISLAQAAAAACAFLPPHQDACPGATGGQTGLTAVYGPEAMDILRFLVSGPDVFEQSGSAYAVRAVPLLPDALHPDADTAPGALIVTPEGMQRVSLIPPPSAS
jgi:hypothetical protein